jgi:hypothetical protein
VPESSYVIFDLEYATDHTARALGWGGFGQHKEVIQIGAMVVESGEDWIHFAQFERLVKPLYTELNDFTTSLTGITQARMDADGVDAEEAFAEFAEFIGKLPVFSNGNDVNQLNETCGLHGFVRPYKPAQFGSMLEPLYDALHNEMPSDEFVWKDYPSGRVHELLDIPVPAGLGQVHDAMRDVWSLWATTEELAKRGCDIIPGLKQTLMLYKLRVPE